MPPVRRAADHPSGAHGQRADERPELASGANWLIGPDSYCTVTVSPLPPLNQWLTFKVALASSPRWLDGDRAHRAQRAVERPAPSGDALYSNAQLAAIDDGTRLLVVAAANNV